MSAASFIHASETVRDVAEHLLGRNTSDLVDELRAARELGVYVYSSERWDGDRELIASREVERLFRELSRFSAAAATADQVVTVHRG